ncbi:hypothetical protein F5B21DRAFT_493388 [Xylaria acuta]|nr:hypothetical protein F5B21DRAFT_493388 [Xylaria acuta]
MPGTKESILRCSLAVSCLTCSVTGAWHGLVSKKDSKRPWIVATFVPVGVLSARERIGFIGFTVLHNVSRPRLLANSRQDAFFHEGLHRRYLDAPIAFPCTLSHLVWGLPSFHEAVISAACVVSTYWVLHNRAEDRVNAGLTLNATKLRDLLLIVLETLTIGAGAVSSLASAAHKGKLQKLAIDKERKNK